MSSTDATDPDAPPEARPEEQPDTQADDRPDAQPDLEGADGPLDDALSRADD